MDWKIRMKICIGTTFENTEVNFEKLFTLSTVCRMMLVPNCTSKNEKEK